MVSRRNFLAGSAALPAAAMARVPTAASDRIAADLTRYIGFGSKQAGGAGDNGCGDWLAGELEALGFKTERQSVPTPFFEPQQCDLVCGDAKAKVWPQPIVTPTGSEGVTGPLVRIDANGEANAPLAGAIALVELPFARWSTAIAKPVRGPVEAAFAAGAKGVVIITNGPSGKVIALNADGRKPMFAGPVAVLAPEDAKPFLSGAIHQKPATLILTGTGGRRPAFNLIGRIDRGKGRWLAVSTPRSGWFTCAGERGPGVAAWLHIARWASKAVKDHDLAFIVNSGHEYEYLGASEALKAIAPPPDKTRFWLHLGANVAAREWQEVGPTKVPLPSADTQRCLSVTPDLLPLAREVFAGQVGLEAPYSSEVLAAGEQTEILSAGYKPVAAVFGIHRFHHVADDDARCVNPATVAETAEAFRLLVERAIR